MGVLSTLGNVALGQPPQGQKANFDNAESNALQAYLFTAICGFLVLVFTAFKTYAHARLHLVTTWMDYYYIFTLIAGLAYMGLVCFLFSGRSFSYHAWDVRLKDITLEQLQVSLALSIIFSPIMFFVKLNLFLLFLQVFKIVRWLRILTYIGIVASFILYSVLTILSGYFCAPRTGSTELDYLLTMDSAQCLDNVKPTVVIGAALNVAIDIYILVIPLPAITSLRLPLRRKLGVLSIFLTGILAIVASVLALVFKIQLYGNDDNTWDATPVHSMCILEISAGLIIPCFPSASKVLGHMVSRIPWARNWLRTTATVDSQPLTPLSKRELKEVKPPVRTAAVQTWHHSDRDATTLVNDSQDWPLKTNVTRSYRGSLDESPITPSLQYPPQSWR